MELNLEPIRVKNADGNGFTPIDTTLVETGGAIKPKAIKGDLTLSAGGDTTAITTKNAKATARVEASAKLPKPALKGNTATYVSAYGKDTDLVVTATPTGFRQQIVIRQRPIGPVSFRIPMQPPKGLSLGKSDKGQPALKTEDGKTFLDIRPAPLLDAVAADPSGDLETAKVGRAAVALDGSDLVYRPDPAFLADPATTYPVTMAAVDDDWYECEIDTPSSTYCPGGVSAPYDGEPMDTFVNNADYPDSWSNFNLDRILVGKSNSGSVRWRSYIQFPLPAKSDPFWGSTIQNADLTLWNHLSNDCGLYVGSGITARRVISDWDELEMTWSNQPSVTSAGADTEYGGYNSASCSGSYDYEWDLIHSVNGIVQEWANGEPNYGFQLTAGNESDITNWRRYRTRESTYPYPAHAPRLSVDFEPPAPPRRETVVITSREPLTTIPEYEEALTKSVHVPEVIDSVAMTDEQVAAMDVHRDGEGSLITTDKLPPPLPYPGDSDDTGNSDSEDTSAPRVLATEPIHEATDVPLGSPVRVTFSEDVDGTKISVKSSQGSEVEGTVGSDSTGRIVTFTPSQPLRPGTTYTVDVSEAIDSWENVMRPYTWSFTTLKQAAGHWTFDEGNGRTAADSSGNGYDAGLNDTAAWITGKDGHAISNLPSQARSAAVQAAVKQGKAIEVADETTATSITYAQPDGKTFKIEVTAGPVRTRQGGGWVPIDTTLAEQDGKLRPKAMADGAVVEISAGGKDPYAKMSADGKSYALRWPTPLPKPTVKGAVATYTDAAGVGADLVVTALPAGFRHEVVLRQRPAKQVELRIAVEDEGLTLSEGKGGRLLLKGKDNKLVAAGTPPVVSDGGVKDRPASVKRGKTGADVVTRDGRTELVVKPDQKFLADAATTYPVRVTAAVALPLAADVDVTTYEIDYPADPSLDYLMAGTMSDGSKYRTHLRFDTTGLPGSTVTDATLSLNSFDAHNCGPALARGIQVARLTGGWDPENLYWDTKPAFTTEDASTNFKGVNLDCEVWPDSMEWNVTGIAQDWAAGAANHGLVLKSPGETNVENYRMFNSSEYLDTDGYPPTLTVTTSGPVSQPVVSDPAIAPAQTVDGVTVTTSLTPQLAATVADTAGGNLTGQFELEHDPAATGQGTGQIWTGDSPAVISGGQAAVSVPAGKLTDGWKIRWRARAVSSSTASAWTDWQSATVDVPNPTVDALQVTPSQMIDGATVATSLTPALHATVTGPTAQPLRAEYELEHDPAATGQGTGQIWTGAVDNVASGTQASATVPGGKLADGWKVRWRVRAVNTVSSPWSDWQNLTIDVPDPVSEPAVGALQVTPSEQVDGATVTPTRTPSLLAQVTDPAGKPLRAEAEIEHDPAAPADQGAGQIWTGGVDGVPAGAQATITVPADKLADEWKVRWRARAVSDTAASAWSDWQIFTVSLPKPTATSLAITPSKVVDGVTVTTRLTPTLQATLTHPTGQALRAEAEIEHDPAAPDGQGTGQIWAGSVDDVASGTQTGLTVPDGKLTDGWKVRWRLRAVSEQAPSTWSDWQQVTVDLTQPGEEPLAQTAGPVIRTDQSFTIAAWLRWNDKEGDYAIVEQRGTHRAPFRLGNTADHGLVFTFAGADTADAPVEGVLSGVEPPVNEWFHLTGVYDVATGTVSLYLNGTVIKTASVSFPAWNADTAMSLGSKMRGDLDDVRIYQRPFSADDVTSLYASATAPPPAGAPAVQKEAGSASAVTQTGNFDYEHLSLEKCQVSPGETGYAEYDARIRELPYASCWSSYLYVQDYEENDSDGVRKMLKSNLKSAIIKLLIKELADELTEPFDDDDVLRFRATWVIHSYLGDPTGNAVVGGAGSGLKPTDMKMFLRIDELAVVDGVGGRVKVASNKLRGFNMSPQILTGTWSGGEGSCEIDDGRRSKDISDWHAKSDELFLVRASTQRTVICSYLPYLFISADGVLLTLPLWSQKVQKTSDAKTRGVLRHGSDEPSDSFKWKPNFRCDRILFGAKDPEIEDRFGGCINTRAKRVLVMSKTGDKDFIEVIEHIEDALNPSNSGTFPPLRPGGHTPSYPPTRKILGNEQNKLIPGNWAAPRDTFAGNPLTLGKPGVQNGINRKAFSSIPMFMDLGTPDAMQWLIPPDNSTHARNINYCKYYMQEKYPKPFRADKLPMGGGLHCDEYPFAATVQGAANANGHYSVRAVNGAQNSLQGSRAGSFYTQYRVGEGNKFWVLITP
ncbi:DNRLRE domain-containing protein [Nonomuraea sp. NPDC050202]|uniref:DNRLRE domain-containing protein n=1 Tax=Nonomuraea sp. NPDC050202 TaxID=3155035 RepID=UPI0033D5588F